MTECKYKFQNEEKFDGKPYCNLHNELCEDLSFACDKNCQIYEDYKELEEFKTLYKFFSFDGKNPENIEELKICINGTNQELINLQNYIKEDLKPHTQIYIETLKDIKRIVKELKQTKIPFCTLEETIREKIDGVIKNEI